MIFCSVFVSVVLVVVVAIVVVVVVFGVAAFDDAFQRSLPNGPNSRPVQK